MGRFKTEFCFHSMQIPSEVKHNDVRELKLIFSNPHAPLGEDDRNVFIDAGTVGCENSPTCALGVHC